MGTGFSFSVEKSGTMVGFGVSAWNRRSEDSQAFDHDGFRVGMFAMQFVAPFSTPAL
jgi:hypothetical protein